MSAEENPNSPSLGEKLDARFQPGAGAVDPPGWRPDADTLRWVLGRLDAELIAQAMAADVPPRQQAEDDYSDRRMWYFAADAAIEAILFPAIRAADDMGSQMKPRALQRAEVLHP